jgi:predicted unusual protein kinase regulating ubiquinone biosynthesis (AarF/ABC1/UbiB family)
MMAEAARRLVDGERPRIRDLLLTPSNVGRLTDRLSHLRGAAMKLGQMISLDAGDFLPAELTDIMARLRERARHMPAAQLQKVLVRAWGPAWRRRFDYFDATPVAAASIGQVHRAVTKDGRELAIKVQYPGVRESIDADIDNVALLLRMSGLLPRTFDIAPLLEEAKRQLHEEADYRREGEQMTLFGRLLAHSPGFVVPELAADLTTDRVLAMTYVSGRPVESLGTAPLDERNRVTGGLMRLVLRELFEFGVMQTDPNFANYRYQPDSGRLVLLDFGAARRIAPETQRAYRALLRAALAGDPEALTETALSAGLLNAGALERHRAGIDAMIGIIIGEIARPGPFDFGDRRFVAALRDEGLAIAADQASWHVPPPDMLFVQRKISGTALLAARLQARVDIRSLVTEAEYV